MAETPRDARIGDKVKSPNLPMGEDQWCEVINVTPIVLVVRWPDGAVKNWSRSILDIVVKES